MKKRINNIITIGVIICSLLTGCNINETVSHKDEYSSPISQEAADEIIEENYDAAEWTDEDEDSKDMSPTEKPTSDKLASFQNFDHWTFKNYSSEKYNIHPDDAERLMSELSNADKMTIRKTLLYNRPAGHCYGMSVTAAITNKGIASANEISSSSTLKNASKNDSVLEYYFVQQALSLSVTKESEFLALSNDEQISKLMRIALSGDPFVVAFGWFKDASSAEMGHAVVGYGVETGDWSKVFPLSHNYPYRIHIYDSNFPDNKNGLYDLYVNYDEKKWCIPGYNIYSCTSSNIAGSTTDNGRLYRIVTDEDYLNVVDYTTGNVSDAYKTSNGSSIPYLAVEKRTNLSIETSAGFANVNGTTISNSSLQGIQAFAMCDASNETPPVIITMPENGDFYKIDSDNDNLDFIFRVGTTCLTVDSNSPGEAKIESNGKVEIICDRENATTTIDYATSDKNMNSDGNNVMTIKENNGSFISIVPTINGIKVSADPNANLNISAEKYGISTKQIDAKTDNNNISISTDKENIIIKDIENSTVIATENVPKLNSNISLKSKKVAYTGKTININAASKKNINSKIYYTYYTNKQCTRLAKNHSNVGKYYVQAKAIVNGYSVKSNIAKLEITKSAEKIKLIKNSLDCKSTLLKKKSQTFTLKTNGKGAMNFKKISGNKNITIAANGKVTIKKGTKKGTYKVKMKVSSPNYKNSRTQSISVKVK